jgi:hypothetical protein
MCRESRRYFAAGLIALLLTVAGCQTRTTTQSIYEDIELGKLVPGWLKTNRLATASDFGYTYLEHTQPDSRSQRLESYRVAVSHGRVLAKSYMLRRGWESPGSMGVEYRYILETEVEPSAWRPPDSTWQPVGHDQALSAVAVAIDEAVPDRAYPGSITPPENFLDIRRMFFEEVEAKVYAEALSKSFGQVAVVDETPAQLEAEVRDYRRQINLIQREINVVEEQLVRLNYQFEFADRVAERQRYDRLRDALEAKLLRLQQNRNQITALMQNYAAGDDVLLAARWRQASGQAQAQARRALASLKRNIAGWLVTHRDLLPLLPGPTPPPETIWYNQAWSKLWPRYAFVNVLRRIDWTDMAQEGFEVADRLPQGVDVTVKMLGQRRCRVEIHYRFQQWGQDE